MSQIALTAGEVGLSPSKGGGFGMFATIDQAANRIVRAHLIDAQGRQRPVPPRPQYHLDQYIYRSLPYPSDRRLRRIGQVIAEAHRGEGFEKVRVELWKARFDPEVPEMRRHKVRELFVDVPTP